jgi:signal transduction histidine kinase
MDEGRDGAARRANAPATPRTDRRSAADRRFARRGAAHDARLALATVRALLTTQLERDPQLPPDVVACLHDATREVDRVTVLLAPDVGGAVTGACDLGAVARDVARAQAVLFGIPVTCRAPTIDVACDHTKLWRALTNLVHNACRAAGPAGAVSVAATFGAHPDAVVVRVRDTGAGCAPPWTAGIGLEVVGRLLDTLGGSLDAAGVPGGGTEVAVTLPVAAPARTSSGCVTA